MKKSLPWVEKYRPDDLNDIVDHPEIINTLTNLINNNKLSHMIFYGSSGTGKTTTIIAAAKKIYGVYYKSMILELNGSDDRGINVVRDQIKNFSATDSKISSIFENNNNTNNTKLVILDEADAMTYDAQFALRRVIEIYTSSTRFCLICNYLSKIIPAIQSRCQILYFTPISNEFHISKINEIIEKENIKIDEITKLKIIELAEGDMRKSINLLQSLNMINNNIITIDFLYKSIGYLSEENRNIIINTLKKKSINEIYNELNELVDNYCISNNDIIKELTQYVSEIYLKLNKKLKNQNKILDFFCDLGKIEIFLSNNTNNNIQLLAISSIIYNFNN